MLRDGCRVEILGLQARPEMNGRAGFISGEFNQSSGRWTVVVDAHGDSDACQLAVKPVNINVINSCSSESHGGTAALNPGIKMERVDAAAKEAPAPSTKRARGKGAAVAAKAEQRLDSDDDAPLKPKTSATSTPSSSAAASSTTTMKEFQKGWWELHDRLAHVDSADLLLLLSCNGVSPPGARPSRDTIVSAATNVMYVGVPPPCPVCSSSLRIDNLQWKCTGRMSEWTECAGPPHAMLCTKPELPENFGGKSFKFKFIPHALPVFHMASITELAPPISVRSAVALPLAGCKFHISGNLSQTPAKIAAEIRRLGGSVAKSALGADVTHLLTDGGSVGAGEVSQALAGVGGGVVAVDERWLQLVATNMTVDYAEGVIGGNVPSFNPKFSSQKRRAEGVEAVEVAPKMRKVSVREGSEVFSESGLDVFHHSVAKDAASSRPLTATLNLTDVLKNKNSYAALFPRCIFVTLCPCSPAVFL
jgi:hypothetical protein